MRKKLNDAQSEINKMRRNWQMQKIEIKENEQKLTDGQAEYDAEYEEIIKSLKMRRLTLSRRKQILLMLMYRSGMYSTVIISLPVLHMPRIQNV